MLGNVDAYGKVVDIYKEYLYKMAWLYVRNEDLALDIVQDSILKRISEHQIAAGSPVF